MVDVRRLRSKPSTERPFLFSRNTSNPHAVTRSRLHVSKKHACRTYPNTRASLRPSVPVRLGHDNLRIYSLFTMTKIDNAHGSAPGSKALPRQTMANSFPALKPDLTGLTRRATHTRRKAKALRRSGGARRDRTDDLMLAKHALSQLSYGPILAKGQDVFLVLRA